MGQEISTSRFDEEDFRRFQARLVEETALLEQWLAEGRLDGGDLTAGCELEAWLVDDKGLPMAVNQPLLKMLDDPMVVPELAAFNVELNTEPARLGPSVFDWLHQELHRRWKRCREAAGALDAHMVMIGILPTVRKADLTLENISALQRYQALNEQVLRMRNGAPLEVDIAAAEHLRTLHHDVMLEAATTSFQIHLRIGAERAGRAFNLEKMISAPMVAVSANSPWLFGHDLWDETRIPLFEQSVAVGASDHTRRVTFGVRYVRESIIEVFIANRDRYPVLLPQVMDEPPGRLAHLRLHNGTIWRWNRPLIGFDDDGRPHVRLEHRVVPSGPSPTDLVANAAFHFGLLNELLAAEGDPEQRLPFETARDNFYRAARDGLDAEITWFDGWTGPIDWLLAERLIPQARSGLYRLGLPQPEVDRWLAPIEGRVAKGQTGARWQRRWVAAHGRDFPALVQAYRRHQDQDRPVHQWDV